jgi:hypothetical protein
MPKWQPGMQRGKAVRVKYLVPVNFKLDWFPFVPKKALPLQPQWGSLRVFARRYDEAIQRKNLFSGLLRASQWRKAGKISPAFRVPKSRVKQQLND